MECVSSFVDGPNVYLSSILRASGCGVLSMFSWNSRMQPLCLPVVLPGRPHWLPKLKPGFSCNNATSKQNLWHRAWGLFISISETGFTPSLLSRNNVCDDCACVGVWGSESMSVYWGSVILQVAHGGLTCPWAISPRHVHLRNGF